MRFFKLAMIFCVLVAAIPETASPVCRACRRARYASSNGAAGAQPSGVSTGARSIDPAKGKEEAERDFAKRAVEDSSFQRSVALQVLAQMMQSWHAGDSFDASKIPSATDSAKLMELELHIKSNSDAIGALRDDLNKQTRATTANFLIVKEELEKLHSADEGLSAKLDSHFKALTEEIKKLAAGRANMGGTEGESPTPQKDAPNPENPFGSAGDGPLSADLAPKAAPAVD